MSYGCNVNRLASGIQLSRLKFIVLFGKMMMTFYDGTNGDVLTSKDRILSHCLSNYDGVCSIGRKRNVMYS